MCGRICCALCAPIYESAASYYDKAAKRYKKPSFITSRGFSFNPSTNISPTEVIPVLVWDKIQKCPVIRPMVWGINPPWKKEVHNFGPIHNSRLEKITESRLFSTSQRCVILCEGYYEWKSTIGKHKQPFFIYKKQPEGMKAEEESHWIGGEWSEVAGWSGPSLTYLAGIYYSSENAEENKPTLSASVISTASSGTLSHIHHRMPVVLNSAEQIKNWLNSEDIDTKVAVSKLEFSESLESHEVSTDVNNSRNKTPNCNKQVNTKKQGGKQTSLNFFFKKIENSIENDVESPMKKVKKDGKFDK